MQLSPSADTDRPDLPSSRVCIHLMCNSKATSPSSRRSNRTRTALPCNFHVTYPFWYGVRSIPESDHCLVHPIFNPTPTAGRMVRYLYRATLTRIRALQTRRANGADLVFEIELVEPAARYVKLNFLGQPALRQQGGITGLKLANSGTRLVTGGTDQHESLKTRKPLCTVGSNATPPDLFFESMATPPRGQGLNAIALNQ
jgi:hypothetical protein